MKERNNKISGLSKYIATKPIGMKFMLGGGGGGELIQGASEASKNHRVGFLHSNGTMGCAARKCILFRTSSLAKGIHFGNFSRF